jgi:hypothetical protein
MGRRLRVRPEPRPWDWPPPRRVWRRPPVYVEHERLRPRSFWATRTAQVLARAMLRIGVGVWVVAIIGALLMMMSFAVIVLVALVKAVLQ